MVIIFYDSEKESIIICTQREKMRIVPVDDPNLMSYIPNDDILYVQNANFITKQQFGDWLEGKGDQNLNDFPDTEEEEFIQSNNMTGSVNKYVNSKWIHPKHNGAILIPDIKTKDYPDGLELVGKYHFVPIDSIGGMEFLKESSFFKGLMKKGKIEVVGYDYVKKHHGKGQKRSLADQALDAILIKNDAKGSAEFVAAEGGIGSGGSGSDPIEFFVE